MDTRMGMSARMRVGALAVGVAVSLMIGVAGMVAPAGAVAADVTVAVTSSANPSTFGQAVVLRAVVTDPSTPRSQRTGSMTFSDGATVLGVRAVSKGMASLSIRTLGAGDHAIVASFVPAAGGGPFDSGPVSQHVAAGSTATTLSATRPVSYSGQPGNVVAAVKPVAPATAAPSGTVDFSVDGSWFWTSTVGPDGKAMLPYADLAPGTYVLTATYSGDANYDPSSSASSLTQTILPNAPTAGLAFSPSTISVGGRSLLVVSATNNGPTPMANVAIGVVLPSLPVGVVSQPPGAGCRRALGNVIYCLVSVPRGATRKLVLEVSATAPGSYSATSYARNIDTGDETSASATLIVA